MYKEMRNGSVALSWNIADFYDLDYKQDTIKTSYQLHEFASSGHNLDRMVIYNYFEPNPMPPGVELVKQHFEKEYKCVSIAVNMFKPGTYVPYHNDLYQRYRQVNNISNAQPIYRFVVMLDDGAHGQMLHIGENIHYLWQAGDYFGWINDQIHSSYNMSNTNRYALQVTATK